MQEENSNQTLAGDISPDNSDLHDSVADEKSLQEKEIFMDLPEVKDIPGQENIVPPKMNSFADTTIASDDEEGKNVIDADSDEMLSDGEEGEW